MMSQISFLVGVVVAENDYKYLLEQKYANEVMSFYKTILHVELLRANEPNQNHTKIILR